MEPTWQQTEYVITFEDISAEVAIFLIFLSFIVSIKEFKAYCTAVFSRCGSKYLENGWVGGGGVVCVCWGGD